MKKLLIITSLILGLAGCNEERFIVAKDWQAPTHTGETPITYEKFVRTVIKNSTQDKEPLKKDDIVWEIAKRNGYQAVLKARYNEVEMNLNILNNDVKNVQLFVNGVENNVRTVINNSKLDVVKKMTVPSHYYIDYLRAEHNASIRYVQDFALICLQELSGTKLSPDNLEWKFLGETSDGFIVGASYAKDYVLFTMHYNGDFIRFNKDDIVIHCFSTGVTKALSEL